ncbi:hypothetical protein PV327_007899 [Microctonus hyperodae]|uniref:Uncharacterized protein n=1 Tax=Microctonus hyperodae TaxID=165561 RepID=A0AA39G1H6_MICHY|nr:hypothetical protein PV327_007899 [Microctonus hyperodae]
MWKFVTVLVFLFVTVSSLPLDSDKEKTSTEKNGDVPTLATELLPPREDAEIGNFSDLIAENSAPSKELLPPPEGTIHKGVVFLINLYAINNETGEDANEIFTENAIKNTPALAEPLATVLLLVEEEDKDRPVSLDEVAKDLEEEGFKVEKIVEDGDTKVIKVDFDGEVEHPDVEMIEDEKSPSLRQKRSPHGLISKLLNKHMGGGGGGCRECGGGNYGGYPNGGTVGVIPIVVVPVQGGRNNGGYGRQHQYQHPPQQYHNQPQYYEQPQYQPQPHYPPPQNYPSGGQCNTCGGNHGSYSQASAQASSNSW